MIHLIDTGAPGDLGRQLPRRCAGSRPLRRPALWNLSSKNPSVSTPSCHDTASHDPFSSASTSRCAASARPAATAKYHRRQIRAAVCLAYARQRLRSCDAARPFPFVTAVGAVGAAGATGVSCGSGSSGAGGNHRRLAPASARCPRPTPCSDRLRRSAGTRSTGAGGGCRCARCRCRRPLLSLPVADARVAAQPALIRTRILRRGLAAVGAASAIVRISQRRASGSGEGGSHAGPPARTPCMPGPASRAPRPRCSRASPRPAPASAALPSPHRTAPAANRRGLHYHSNWN